MSIFISPNFQNAMMKAGLDCPATIIADGKIHRFKQDGDKGNPCWYVLYDFYNGFICGAFGCWKRGICERWRNKDVTALSDSDREIYKQKHEQLQRELKETRDKTKEHSRYIWEHSEQYFKDHPYLTNKQIKDFGLRLYRKMLIVPLYNNLNELCSLQFITEAGDKGFKKNSCTKGCYFAIGDTSETIYIAEGYATAATIHEATGCYVIVAFNANNLLPVAQIIRKKYPTNKIIVCADNDQY